MVGNPRIMVVDDEERNRVLIEALLVPLGYEIVTAASGEEALAKVGETRPDVVLLDIMMPRMDGYEVARRLKNDEETRIIPIVMVTALQNVEDRVKSIEAGADDFLTKPIEKTELRARVRSLVKVKAYNDGMRNYQRELEAEVARRTEELSDAFRKLKESSLEMIYRLSQAAEYKDEDTGLHVLRVGNYSALLARALGLGDDFAENMLRASPMHDVGKIGIPDQILLKPAKLDPAEWAIMKQHPLIGSQILKDSESGLIRLAEIIALNHHERWDGSGYPAGLRGEEIPMAGRITAVADVFDALVSRRPYKKPLPLQEAMTVMGEGKGSHFDPRVVDAFFSIRVEIVSVKDRLADGSMKVGA
jgi:putative two-component system response regulator